MLLAPPLSTIVHPFTTIHRRYTMSEEQIELNTTQTDHEYGGSEIQVL